MRNFIWAFRNMKRCPFQLEPLIAAGAFNEAGGLQFSRVIERSLVDVFVPFLPLERTHVKACVRNELQRRAIVAGPEVGYFKSLDQHQNLLRWWKRSLISCLTGQGT